MGAPSHQCGLDFEPGDIVACRHTGMQNGVVLRSYLAAVVVMWPGTPGAVYEGPRALLLQRRASEQEV